MSGNFTQRGEAAVLPPIPRAAMALAAGADLVLELPFPFASGSARYFATAGVRALSSVGCDALMFGSESVDITAILAAAKKLNSPDFTVEGTEPTLGDARAHFEALGIAPHSNDILAIEYARAILDEHSQMKILPVLRLGSGYNEQEIGGEFPSASALRAALARDEDITPILPPVVQDIWKNGIDAYGGIASVEGLGAALLSRLRTQGEPQEIADIGGGLYAHLAKAAGRATDYASLCREAATKRYTNGRIRRALLYLLSGVTREDLLAPPAYLRLLGANEVGREYLSATRKTRTVPVVTKQADVAALGESAARARALAAAADALYALCLPRPTLPATLCAQPPVML
jgi:predicted nucleotidyltransferase